MLNCFIFLQIIFSSLQFYCSLIISSLKRLILLLKINYYVLGTVVTILCGSIKLDMNKYVCVIIIVISFIQSVALYTSAVCNSVYISYVNYIVFSTIYQGMMTIVRLNIFI